MVQPAVMHARGKFNTAHAQIYSFSDSEAEASIGIAAILDR